MSKVRMTRTEYSHFLEETMGIEFKQNPHGRWFWMRDGDDEPVNYPTAGFAHFQQAVENARDVLNDNVELVGQ